MGHARQFSQRRQKKLRYSAYIVTLGKLAGKFISLVTSKTAAVGKTIVPYVTKERTSGNTTLRILA